MHRYAPSEKLRHYCEMTEQILLIFLLIQVRKSQQTITAPVPNLICTKKFFRQFAYGKNGQANPIIPTVEKQIFEF